MNTGDTDLPPITQLRELDQDVSPHFVSTLRRKIYRRTTATQFANFGWSLPQLVALEFVRLLVHLVSFASGDKGKRG